MKSPSRLTCRRKPPNTGKSCSNRRADCNEVLMEKYLEGKEISEAELRGAIRSGTLSLKIVPILCGSAFRNKGVQPMLDAVVDYLPSPLDILPVKGR
mgnify:CR=1 FL=1